MSKPKQLILDTHDELIVDNFAGGGGASTGIELALGRNVDIAINHDAQALAMHAANHPQTLHLQEDVFAVDPRKVTKGRRVGLAWFSPDCKHHSKAKGGKPRDKKIRGLAWVAVKWAATVRPRVIILENVEEFAKWGPLLKDGSPCRRRQGRTFVNFKRRLENLGYVVDHRELRACDYGAPTTRKRLFLIARCDGRPIVWPQPTHAAPKLARKVRLKPWRTAAECIDWRIPCPSIFLTREEARVLGVKRPLADATLRRIARGIMKFVVNTSEPFIVNVANSKTTGRGPNCWTGEEPVRTITSSNGFAVVTPFLTEHANGSSQRVFAPDEPMRTQCAEVKGGHFALAQAFLAKHYTGVTGQVLGKPIGTVTGVDHHSLVTAHITKFRTGSTGTDLSDPLHTITAGPKQRPAGAPHALGLVSTHLTKLYGTTTGQPLGEPMHTVTGGGQHIAEVRAFLIKYYGQGGQLAPCTDPMHTVTAKERVGLVTVRGQDYVIADIGLRMLEPHELFRAQGFPKNYIIAPRWQGKPMPKTAQVRMCGNSVCPPIAAALVAANVPEMKS
jgi:DNA (cytosine-5)-methyltransferase 1